MRAYLRAGGLQDVGESHRLRQVKKKKPPQGGFFSSFGRVQFGIASPGMNPSDSAGLIVVARGSMKGSSNSENIET